MGYIKKADYIARFGDVAWKARAEKKKEYDRQYRDENKERLNKQAKQYRGTQWGRASNIIKSYNKSDKNRGFSTDQNIDRDWIVENIFKSQCIYCGESDWTKLGCDRIDNSKPHTPDNCVCSCEKCNKARKNNYTVEEFKMIKKKD